jgi:MATE family multidrug resistance protein
MDDNGPKKWIPDFLRPSKSKSSPDLNARTEASSLLPKPSNASDGVDSREQGETYELEDADGKSRTRLIYEEFMILLKGSIPVILAYSLQNSLQTISVVIVGRDKPEDLATAAFAYMFAMSTAWLIALGGTTAIDTLCSSSFTGSRNPHDLGIILQRAFIVLSAFYVPVAILWIFSEPVFLALGQDAQISRDSARFLSCLIPGGLGYIYFEALKKYLQAQGFSSHCHYGVLC